MAEEKKEAKPAAPAKEAAKEGDAHGKAGKGGIGAMLTKLPVLLGGVMVLEAVVLFAGFKFLGGGKPTVVVGADLVAKSPDAKPAAGAKAGGEGSEGGAAGEGGAATGPTDKNATIEIPVVDMKAPNKMSGRSFIYDVSIFAVTKAGNEDTVKNCFKDHEALIKDRIRTIIAESDPEKLGGGTEPGLETLRRQIKYQLDEIAGDGMIDEVLVPRCIPFRSDY